MPDKKVASVSDIYEVYLGTFNDNKFTWYSVSKHKDIIEAYKAYKKYVNTQLQYTDEELKKVWDTGRLDVELRQGNKLLNWVGIYSRKVTELTKEEAKESEEVKSKKKDKDDKKEKKDSVVTDSLPEYSIIEELISGDEKEIRTRVLGQDVLYILSNNGNGKFSYGVRKDGKTDVLASNLSSDDIRIVFKELSKKCRVLN